MEEGGVSGNNVIEHICGLYHVGIIQFLSVTMMKVYLEVSYFNGFERPIMNSLRFVTTQGTWSFDQEAICIVDVYQHA